MAFENILRVARVAALALLSLHAAPARADEKITVDWSRGAAQQIAASCGTVILKNMADKQAYSLWVRGTASATCHFEADGLIFHYPPNYGSTDVATTTIFAFQRFGADVLIAWTPGY